MKTAPSIWTASRDFSETVLFCRRARWTGAGRHADRAGGAPSGVLLDLDFRRTPSERLVDEQGRSGQALGSSSGAG